MFVLFYFVNLSRSSKLFTIATIGIAGTSLAVYIAKHDDEFRDWVKDNIPQLDSLVAVVYQEDETYNEFLQRIYNQLTQGYLQYFLFNPRCDGLTS